MRWRVDSHLVGTEHRLLLQEVISSNPQIQIYIVISIMNTVHMFTAGGDREEQWECHGSKC